MMKYWLMKSEPETYGIDDLKRDKVESWDGIRNYQARNFMRDDMKKGDLAFFYHSNCAVPGIVGVMEIVREAHPDNTQFNPESDYYDPKSSQDNPRWVLVDVKFNKKFKHIVSLHALREYPELAEMVVLRPRNRLSISPVTQKEWDYILSCLAR